MAKRKSEPYIDPFRRVIPFGDHDTPSFVSRIFLRRGELFLGRRAHFAIPLPSFAQIAIRWNSYLEQAHGWRADWSGWLVGRMCYTDIEPRRPYIITAAVTLDGNGVDAFELLNHIEHVTLLQSPNDIVPAAFRSSIENDLAAHLKTTIEHWAKERESHLFGLEIDQGLEHRFIGEIESELRRRRKHLPPPEASRDRIIDDWRSKLQAVETEDLRLELQTMEDEEFAFFNRLEEMRRESPCWSYEPFLEITWRFSA